MIKPLKTSTAVNQDGHEWRPASFSDFLEELAHLNGTINEACFFRGQRKSDRLLDSTLARNIKLERGMDVIQLYTDKELNSVSLQHQLAQVWLRKFRMVQLSPQLQMYVKRGVDGYFEYHRHYQQNPDDPLLKDYPPFGTNFIDFSYNWKVGLFFANRRREKDDEGALFVVRQTALGPVLYQNKDSVSENVKALEIWLRDRPNDMYPHLPLMIYPKFQLNNWLDPKPNRQEAVYMMQVDFRCELEFSWKILQEEKQVQVFTKLILPAGSHDEVESYLSAEGITEKYLFPPTKFDKADAFRSRVIT
jgi:hypothetical protein